MSFRDARLVQAIASGKRSGDYSVTIRNPPDAVLNIITRLFGDTQSVQAIAFFSFPFAFRRKVYLSNDSESIIEIPAMINGNAICANSHEFVRNRATADFHLMLTNQKLLQTLNFAKRRTALVMSDERFFVCRIPGSNHMSTMPITIRPSIWAPPRAPSRSASPRRRAMRATLPCGRRLPAYR